MADSVDVVPTGWIFVDKFVGLWFHRLFHGQLSRQGAVAVISKNGLLKFRAVVARRLHLIKVRLLFEIEV